MAEVLYYAIPFFVLLLVLEYLSFRQVRAENEGLIGYEARDTRTSLTMGLGNVVINVGWKFVVLAAYVGIYELTPLRLSPDDWWWPSASLCSPRPCRGSATRRRAAAARFAARSRMPIRARRCRCAFWRSMARVELSSRGEGGAG